MLMSTATYAGAGGRHHHAAAAAGAPAVAGGPPQALPAGEEAGECGGGAHDERDWKVVRRRDIDIQIGGASMGTR